MYKGWIRLNQEERQHLREAGVRSTADLRRNFEWQAQQRLLGLGNCFSDVCLPCKLIARKLGYETMAQSQGRVGVCCVYRWY